MQRKVCSRKIDELGRIVLPQEVRSTLEISVKQSMDIYIDDDAIVVRKSDKKPLCILCGEANSDFIEIRHTQICINCIAEIQGM